MAQKTPSTYSLIPAGLDVTVQLLLSVGKLVAVWANCESCFYAAYFCLAGTPNGNADIAWASILSTRRRMQLVYNLARHETRIAEATRSELLRCLEEFEPVTEARNYYCHSQYTTDHTQETITSIDNWGLAPIRGTTDPIFKQRSKPANKATVNEICSIADKCVDISHRTAKCVDEIRAQLKIDYFSLPSPSVGT